MPANFSGIRVAAFESRMAEPIANLIARHGGIPVIGPALREVPLEQNPAPFQFAQSLIAGEFDAVLFLTGAGTRYLADTIETRYPRETWLEALGRVRVVARGPKPQAALRALQARIDFVVPEPNTWHEILAILDDNLTLQGLRIAIQEYGQSNPDLIGGLESRGATVTRVPLYRWALPEDLEPLRRAIAELVAGTAGIALFTSSQQVVHLLQVAAGLGLEAALRDALTSRVVVASIGPTTSETLTENGLPVDIVPEHPKMGHLVAAAAERWADLPKTRATTARIDSIPSPSVKPSSDEVLRNSRFLKACRREPVDVTPIWLMRQAGRYMPEYRAVRAKHSFLELCKHPDVATEVTVTAAERLGVDAAILFADILLILEPLGFNLEFAKGEGPVIHNPIRSGDDINRVLPLTDPAPLNYVYEAVSSIRRALKPDLPLIGFAGAPFTLACYAIEGGGSRHYDRAKSFMYTEPDAWHRFMAILVQSTATYLSAQFAAGAQVLQLFDSWVGTLSPDDYMRFVQPHMKTLFDALPPGVPTIHFGTDTGSLLELQRDAGGQVIGLDWRVSLDAAWDRLGPDVAVQGNLDPILLFAPIAELKRQAERILAEANGRPGHVFNLGHGILPGTPVDNVLALIDVVHAWKPAG
jgi:uroporphyrinogen decarboxylase